MILRQTRENIEPGIDAGIHGSGFRIAGLSTINPQLSTFGMKWY
jgi:hypothetical protein